MLGCARAGEGGREVGVVQLLLGHPLTRVWDTARQCCVAVKATCAQGGYEVFAKHLYP